MDWTWLFITCSVISESILFPNFRNYLHLVFIHSNFIVSLECNATPSLFSIIFQYWDWEAVEIGLPMILGEIILKLELSSSDNSSKWSFYLIWFFELWVQLNCFEEFCLTQTILYSIELYRYHVIEHIRFFKVMFWWGRICCKCKELWRLPYCIIHFTLRKVELKETHKIFR